MADTQSKLENQALDNQIRLIYATGVDSFKLIDEIAKIPGRATFTYEVNTLVEDIEFNGACTAASISDPQIAMDIQSRLIKRGVPNMAIPKEQAEDLLKAFQEMGAGMFVPDGGILIIVRLDDYDLLRDVIEEVMRDYQEKQQPNVDGYEPTRDDPQGDGAGTEEEENTGEEPQPDEPGPDTTEEEDDGGAEEDDGSGKPKPKKKPSKQPASQSPQPAYDTAPPTPQNQPTQESYTSPQPQAGQPYTPPERPSFDDYIAQAAVIAQRLQSEEAVIAQQRLDDQIRENQELIDRLRDEQRTLEDARRQAEERGNRRAQEALTKEGTTRKSVDFSGSGPSVEKLESLFDKSESAEVSAKVAEKNVELHKARLQDEIYKAAGKLQDKAGEAEHFHFEASEEIKKAYEDLRNAERYADQLRREAEVQVSQMNSYYQQHAEYITAQEARYTAAAIKAADAEKQAQESYDSAAAKLEETRRTYAEMQKGKELSEEQRKAMENDINRAASNVQQSMERLQKAQEQREKAQAEAQESRSRLDLFKEAYERRAAQARGYSATYRENGWAEPVIRQGQTEDPRSAVEKAKESLKNGAQVYIHDDGTMTTFFFVGGQKKNEPGIIGNGNDLFQNFDQSDTFGGSQMVARSIGAKLTTQGIEERFNSGDVIVIQIARQDIPQQYMSKVVEYKEHWHNGIRDMFKKTATANTLAGTAKGYARTILHSGQDSGEGLRQVEDTVFPFLNYVKTNLIAIGGKEHAILHFTLNESEAIYFAGTAGDLKNDVFPMGFRAKTGFQVFNSKEQFASLLDKYGISETLKAELLGMSADQLNNIRTWEQLLQRASLNEKDREFIENLIGMFDSMDVMAVMESFRQMMMNADKIGDFLRSQGASMELVKAVQQASASDRLNPRFWRNLAKKFAGGKDGELVRQMLKHADALENFAKNPLSFLKFLKTQVLMVGRRAIGNTPAMQGFAITKMLLGLEFAMVREGLHLFMNTFGKHIKIELGPVGDTLKSAANFVKDPVKWTSEKITSRSRAKLNHGFKAGRKELKQVKPRIMHKLSEAMKTAVKRVAPPVVTQFFASIRKALGVVAEKLGKLLASLTAAFHWILMIVLLLFIVLELFSCGASLSRSKTYEELHSYDSEGGMEDDGPTAYMFVQDTEILQEAANQLAAKNEAFNQQIADASFHRGEYANQTGFQAYGNISQYEYGSYQVFFRDSEGHELDPEKTNLNNTKAILSMATRFVPFYMSPPTENSSADYKMRYEQMKQHFLDYCNFLWAETHQITIEEYHPGHADTQVTSSLQGENVQDNSGLVTDETTGVCENDGRIVWLAETKMNDTDGGYAPFMVHSRQTDDGDVIVCETCGEMYKLVDGALERDEASDGVPSGPNGYAMTCTNPDVNATFYGWSMTGNWRWAAACSEDHEHHHYDDGELEWECEYTHVINDGEPAEYHPSCPKYPLYRSVSGNGVCFHKEYEWQFKCGGHMGAVVYVTIGGISRIPSMPAAGDIDYGTAVYYTADDSGESGGASSPSGSGEEFPESGVSETMR